MSVADVDVVVVAVAVRHVSPLAATKGTKKWRNAISPLFALLLCERRVKVREELFALEAAASFPRFSVRPSVRPSVPDHRQSDGGE